MGEQRHTSDARVLDRRTLERDHRHLAELLRPGLDVLDIGCGTGAITSGIARAVGPLGRVVGIDRDEALLLRAATEPNLRFEKGDIHALPYQACFDVVTAARTLQWVTRPIDALRQICRAARPGGLIVVLDYNHAANRWEPEPPAEFRRFYQGFLAWRESNGWDNELAEHLPAMFEECEIGDLSVRVEDETAERGEESALIWVRVAETLGSSIAGEGFFDPAELAAMTEAYREWVETALVRQTLSMRSVVGRVTFR